MLTRDRQGIGCGFSRREGRDVAGGKHTETVKGAVLGHFVLQYITETRSFMKNRCLGFGAVAQW